MLIILWKGKYLVWKEVWFLFFLTALQKLIFTLKMVTRNQKTLKAIVGTSMSASFIAVPLSLCTTTTEFTHPHWFFVIPTNISGDHAGCQVIFMQVKCSQHISKIEPGAGCLSDSRSSSINLISPFAPSWSALAGSDMFSREAAGSVGRGSAQTNTWQQHPASAKTVLGQE